MLYISSINIGWHRHLSFNNPMEFTNGVNLLIGKNGSGKTSVLRMIDGLYRNENVGLDPEALEKYAQNGDEVARVVCQNNGTIDPIVCRRQDNIVQWENWQILQEKVRFITSDRTVTMKSSAASLIPSIQKDISIPAVGAEIDISLEFTQAILKDLWEKIEQTTNSKNIAAEILSDYQEGLVDFEKDIKIDLKRSENPIYFVDYRKKVIQINDLSSGEKEYLYFYAFLRRVKNEENNIILIDEPELHLHSSQLRKLCELIDVLGQKNQVIIATHSGEILQSFITSNIVSLNKGNIVNIKSSVQLKNTLEDIGLPIDPSVFTAHWICAENNPDVPLAGKNAPKTPEVLSWLFGNSVNKKFWSFGQNKENAESIVEGITKTMTNPTTVRLTVLLDGDKQIVSPTDYPPSKKTQTEHLYYLPFWEFENLFLQPDLLNKVIPKVGKKNGVTLFWEKVEERKDILFLQVQKTSIKNFLRTFRVDKMINKKPEEDLAKWKDEISKIDYDSKKVKASFEKVIKKKDWKWIPGKEAFSIVLEIYPDFWDAVRLLDEKGEFVGFISKDTEVSELLKNVNSRIK